MTDMVPQRAPRTVAAAIAFLAAPVAGAQTLDPAGLTFEQPSPHLDISGALDAHYDSNVARVSSAVAERRNLHKTDFVLSPSLNADIVAPTSIATLTLAGYVGYDFHMRNSRLNRERIDLNATAQRRMAVCDVTLSGGASRKQTDLGDLQIVAGDPTASTVNTESQWRMGANVGCGASVGFQPMGYVSYRQIRNSAEVRKFNNANVVDYGGGITYASPAFGKLSLFGGRSEFDYTARGSDPLFNGADQFTYSYVGAKLDRRLGARLQAQAQVTYTKVSVPGRDLSQFNGLNWNVAAQLRLGGRTRISVATARSIDVSAGFRSDFAETTVYSAKIERAISSRTRMVLSAARRERNFAQDSSLALALAADDRTDQLGLSVNFDKSQRLKFIGYVQGQRRRSDLPVLNYNAVQVGLTTSFRF